MISSFVLFVAIFYLFYYSIMNVVYNITTIEDHNILMRTDVYV
jgi:hypothetical protein